MLVKPERECTLSIIKPEAVAKNYIGAILQRIEQANLKITALKMLKLTEQQASTFYDVHRNKPFFANLITYMSSGPLVVSILTGEQAISNYRALMGATDPQKAAPGTLRQAFGETITYNAVHGSDSPETAQKEIAYFFSSCEQN